MVQDRIKSDQRRPEFLAMSMCDMRQVEGGRCWDGPLGDRRECPPKPTGSTSISGNLQIADLTSVSYP
jgi:hypothetical protein